MNKLRNKKEINKKSGFILLLAILITSILLAIGFGIYSLSVKEIILATFLRDSEKAFIAADRALECTLFWERSYPQNGLPYSAFATSTAWVAPLNFNTTVDCDGQFLPTLPSWDNTTGTTATVGTTVFEIAYVDGACADVMVYRVDGQTTVTSNGYSDCNVLNPRRTQRTIQVTTNI